MPFAFLPAASTSFFRFAIPNRSTHDVHAFIAIPNRWSVHDVHTHCFLLPLNNNCFLLPLNNNCFLLPWNNNCFLLPVLPLPALSALLAPAPTSLLRRSC